MFVQKINMKKLLLIMLMSIKALTAQVMVPTHFDSENAAHHIIHGHIGMFVSDSVDWVFEKKPGRYITTFDCPPHWVKSKLDKVFTKGNLEYVSRTNGGYVFTIAVVNKEDDTKVINYCTFHVSAWTQKITEIEILQD
jgi:hypothetical protein